VDVAVAVAVAMEVLLAPSEFCWRHVEPDPLRFSSLSSLPLLPYCYAVATLLLSFGVHLELCFVFWHSHSHSHSHGRKDEVHDVLLRVFVGLGS
jgi:hypothetical protein